MWMYLKCTWVCRPPQFSIQWNTCKVARFLALLIFTFLNSKDLSKKMKPFLVGLLALVLPFTNAQVPHWGPCPEPATQPAFNLKKVTHRLTSQLTAHVSISFLLRSLCVWCSSWGGGLRSPNFQLSLNEGDALRPTSLSRWTDLLESWALRFCESFDWIWKIHTGLQSIPLYWTTHFYQILFS